MVTLLRRSISEDISPLSEMFASGSGRQRDGEARSVNCANGSKSSPATGACGSARVMIQLYGAGKATSRWEPETEMARAFGCVGTAWIGTPVVTCNFLCVE